MQRNTSFPARHALVETYARIDSFDRPGQDDRKDVPPPKSAPRFTLLICLLLGIIASGLLLAYTYAIISYDRKNRTSGRTEVTYEISMDDNMRRNETAFIDNLPNNYNLISFWVMLGASAYAVLVFLLLGLLAWLPDEKSIFLHMPSFLVAVVYFFVVAAVLAQTTAAAYGITGDKNSGTITVAGLQRAGNGTYPGSFAPASWYCDLARYSANANRTQQLHGLCKDATSALGFTAYSTVFSVPVLVAAIAFISAIRERRAWIEEDGAPHKVVEIKEMVDVPLTAMKF